MRKIEDNIFYESALILAHNPRDVREIRQNIIFLEDKLSPVNQQLQKNLYQSLIDKKHIDFGNIPLSKGNIRQYVGYNSMIETLDTMMKLAKDDGTKNVVEYVNILKTTIKYLEMMSSTFEKGFQVNCEFVVKEYNIMVYLCVEATTSLIYQFVDYIKRPEIDTFDIKLRNTKFRGDAFYFNMLEKFNRTMNTNQIEYKETLENAISSQKSNLIGSDDLIGIATVAAVAYFIIPFTRRAIYHFENLKGKLSDSLAAQAYFLEMNKSALNSNTTLDAKKRKEILAKQENMKNKLISLSDKLRVQYTKACVQSKKDLDKDNKLYTIDGLKNQISESDFSIV